MPGPLAGLRVVDCSYGTAGPRATGILADYGADVVWVEPIGGEPSRHRLQVPYAVFNRNKKSVTLDLNQQRHELLKMLCTADLFVESWRPGAATRWGLDYETLHTELPHLVHCSITGFGESGPHRDIPGYESLVHAVLGTMSVQVGFREGPIYQGLPFASIGAASLAVIGSLAALYRGHEDGVGRHVQTSLLDGALAYLGISQADEATNEGVIVPGSKRLVARTFECADQEYIGVHTGSVGGFGRFLNAVGLADRVQATASGRDLANFLTAEERALLDTELPILFAQRPRDEWLKLLLDADIAVNPVLHPGEVFDEEQPRHNGSVVRVGDPDLGPLDQVGPAVRFSAAGRADPLPAPRPGSTLPQDWAHGSGPRTLTGTVQDSVAATVLGGVRILDFGSFHAGPYASRLLADLGADVIKVEPLQGDPCRGMIRPFRSAQAKKRSIAIDLKAPQTKQMLGRLLEWADVVHHNMRPGAAQRLGIGDEQVRELNPDVVYAYSPGWGADGPGSARQSFEPLMSDYVGVSFEIAGQYNPPLFPCGHADPGAGLASAAAILMGLIHRQRTGRGQYLECPQLSAAMLHMAHVVRDDEGQVRGAMRLDALQMGHHALDRLYQTADGWICLVARSDEHVRGIEVALDVEVLGDSHFADAAARSANDDDLTVLLEYAIGGRTTQDVVAALRQSGVPVAEPRTDKLQAFFGEPEHERLRRFATLTSERFGRVREVDALVRISSSEPVTHRMAPELGEHSREVLLTMGESPENVDALFENGCLR